MSKYTICGDIHAKLENLDKVVKLFEKFEQLGNPVILLGDLLDTKDIVRARCLNNYGRLISKSNLKFHILCGNHDQIFEGASETALEPLGGLSNVILVDKPLCIDGHTFLPYIKDLERLRTIISKIPKNTYVFGHLDVQTFDYGNGHVSNKGLQPAELSDFKRVISGHYHAYQELDNLIYLGTPFSHSFGETDQNKYLAILDVESNKLELIPTSFPRHRTLHIDCDAELTKIAKDDRTDILRVVLSGSPENIKKHPRIPGIKYIEQPTIIKKIGMLSELDSPELQFLQWAAKKSDSVKELGLEILRDV